LIPGAHLPRIPSEDTGSLIQALDVEWRLRNRRPLSCRKTTVRGALRA